MSSVLNQLFEADAFSPHGFCLAWQPGLLATHAVSDAVMSFCYLVVSGIIFVFGQRRPDMGPATLYYSLSIVFAMCGATHLFDILVLWLPYYPEQGVLKALAAMASLPALAVSIKLLPQALAAPSPAQLEAVSQRLQEEIAISGVREAHMRRLSMAIEQSPTMVMITDTHGVIEYVNAAFSAMSGYSAQEVVGHKPSVIRSSATPYAVHHALWSALQLGEEWRGELEDLRKDGSSFWVAATISPVRDEAGAITHYVAAEQDITGRKLAERQASEARLQAEMASKAKTELLANMSHELRTPLNAIIGFSDAMHTELFGPLGHPKYKEYAEDIHASGEHLLALINDILDVSAIEAGKLQLSEEAVNLGLVIDACLRLMAGRASNGGVQLLRSDGQAPLVTADERRIRQVILNLLSNAVKFTPQGGEVTIKLAQEDTGDVTITVTDSGIGMSPADIAKALEPFGQVDSVLHRKYEGTGLGLPLSIGLVEMHGGRLVIDSARHKGTSVTVRLPAARVLAEA